MSTGNQEAVSQFINHHVMHHAGSLDAWNLPFYRIDALEWFRYDSVMVFVVGALLCHRLGRPPFPRRFQKGSRRWLGVRGLYRPDRAPQLATVPATGRSPFSARCLSLSCSRIAGLIPLFSTATGNINVTAGLATIFMAASLATIVHENGWRGLRAAFVPGGLPVWLRPVMGFMEVVSFVSRAFALTMRLFCNMLAGHIVIYSLWG